MRDVKTKLMAGILALALMLSLTGCSCEHEWAVEDCNQPQVCTKCGEQGETLGHIYDGWTFTREATLLDPGLEELLCVNCGESSDSREYFKVPEVYDGCFNFREDEWIDYIADYFEFEVTKMDWTLDGANVYVLTQYEFGIVVAVTLRCNEEGFVEAIGSYDGANEGEAISLLLVFWTQVDDTLELDTLLTSRLGADLHYGDIHFGPSGWGDSYFWVLTPSDNYTFLDLTQGAEE